MRKKGYAAILPIIIIIIVSVLALGSFLYTHPGFSLYDLYNIGSPNRTAPPKQIIIDKSEFVKGHILVTFQAGTTYQNAKTIFGKYDITGYENLTWKDVDNPMQNDAILTATDIFKVSVPEGKENEIVTRLKGESSVKSATLDYSGNN